MGKNALRIPRHFNPDMVGKIWSVEYEKIAKSAASWALENSVSPVAGDDFKLCLILVDVQNTFCIPGFELFVRGRSGNAAVDDNVRLCRFIYRNLDSITGIVATMDTHHTIQVFHSIFLVDEKGRHPEPFTVVTHDDIRKGSWRFNPMLSTALDVTPQYGQKYLEHYTRELKKSGKYDLTVWPYHAMMGGVGHAIVPAVEEALFFFSIARLTEPKYCVKGESPLTEHYSVMGPEVTSGPENEVIVRDQSEIFSTLKAYDAIIIAGQAKSHCVAWTISDLLQRVSHDDRGLAEKVYLLEDCTSPVVIPGVVDYTDRADDAFKRFRRAGMHIVSSEDAISRWPGLEKIK